MGSKICTKCNENKLLSEYHRRVSEDDGRKKQCGDCVNSANKASKNPKKPKETHLVGVLRGCACCKNLLDVAFFTKTRKVCKVCVSTAKREKYRIEHPLKIDIDYAPLGMKCCSLCNQNKYLKEFRSQKNRNGAPTSKCIDCINSRNRELSAAKRQNTRVVLAPKTTKKCRVCKEDKIFKDLVGNSKTGYTTLCKKCSKEYQQSNHNKDPSKRKSQQKKWKEANRDKVRQLGRDYKEKNRGRVRDIARVWQANRLKNDPVFKFKQTIRSSLSSAMRRGGFGKKSSTQRVLGCTFEHLYSCLVLSAMDNYGLYLDSLDYEIDHIVPMAIAKTEEDVIRLNHYTNLQLLYPEDNNAKLDSLTWMDDFRRRRDILLTPVSDKMNTTAEQAKDVRC